MPATPEKVQNFVPAPVEPQKKSPNSSPNSTKDSSSSMLESVTAEPPRVVVIGGGFGGLLAAKGLKKAPVHLTLIDRRNFHLFQPLLYQVATAALSPADIAVPIRAILRHQSNAECILAEVQGVDKDKRLVWLKDRAIPYDYLVIATGASHSYFGHDHWAEFAPGLKTVLDATQIRRKILLAFEAAEKEPDPAIRRELLRFVIVGGGPTGVELAGSIAELAHHAIAEDFRHIDPRSAEVVLIEAGPRILAGFPEELSKKATQALEHLGVTVRTGARVQDIDALGVSLIGERILTRSVIWAAGVVASPAGKWLDAKVDRAGRVFVESDLSLAGHPEIFVIGDTCHLEQDGKPLPGVAPVAMQMGRYVAKRITRLVRESGRIAESGGDPFRYVNKGNLATIGRKYAVAEIGKARLSGFFAWLAWALVHIFYLIGFHNRVVVLMEWAWLYLTWQRGARLITPTDHCES